MKKIGFYGASGEVTGSSYVVTNADDSKFLIDFGMFQGPKEVVDLNYQPLPFKPANITAVFLTHAHLDHCGRLPLLVFNGFNGKIYMTAPTRALVEIILNDSAKIAMESTDYAPLYGMEEVEKVMQMIEIVSYEKEFSVGNSSIIYHDAGHILGSSSIEIHDRGDDKRMVFSGDLGNSPEDIVRPTTYIDAADYVVVESTYGDKSHPKEDVSEIIKEEINAIEQNSGVLLIPAFSLERTQELLHRIHHLKKDGLVKADTPVFLDSPMGIHATVIFRDFKEFYNDELRSHIDDPFDFEGLVITEEARDSKEIIKAMAPKVIIAGSGMLSGGRIMHHAVNYLGDRFTRVLFVGYQSEETLGRKVSEGARHITIDRHQVNIKAMINSIESLSSHADQPKLITWISHIKGMQKIFITHGDTTQRESLAQKIKDTLHSPDIILPLNGQEHTL